MIVLFYWLSNLCELTVHVTLLNKPVLFSCFRVCLDPLVILCWVYRHHPPDWTSSPGSDGAPAAQQIQGRQLWSDLSSLCTQRQHWMEQRYVYVKWLIWLLHYFTLIYLNQSADDIVTVITITIVYKPKNHFISGNEKIIFIDIDFDHL